MRLRRNRRRETADKKGIETMKKATTFEEFVSSGKYVQRLANIPALSDIGEEAFRSGRVYDYDMFAADGRDKDGNLILSAVVGNEEYEGLRDCEYALWQFAVEEGYVPITAENRYRLYRMNAGGYWRLDVRGSGCPTVEDVLSEFWHDFHVNNDGELIDYGVVDMTSNGLDPVHHITKGVQFNRDFANRTAFTLEIATIENGKYEKGKEYSSEIVGGIGDTEVEDILKSLRDAIDRSCPDCPVLHVD